MGGHVRAAQDSSLQATSLSPLTTLASFLNTRPLRSHLSFSLRSSLVTTNVVALPAVNF